MEIFKNLQIEKEKAISDEFATIVEGIKTELL